MVISNRPELLADLEANDLGGKAVRGGAVVFGAMAVQKVLALVFLAVLARLLTPEDYGLLGMVYAFVVFLQLFSDLGLTAATVQKAEITQAQISTLFWVNLAFSVLLAGLAAAAAPVIVWFYQEPRLLEITLWLALGFVFAGLGAQHAALMLRRMQFVRLAVCDAAGLAAGAAVGIWLALKGLGVQALVGQNLAQAGTRTVLVCVLSGWLPGRPVRGSGIREMLKFGGWISGFSILNYFARNLDKVLIGRFCGTVALGLYTRAYALMVIPVTFVSGPLGQVTLPALSKLQNDHVRLREAYRKSLYVIALITFPLAAGLFTTADEVIVVLFGPQWAPAAPIFRILCLVGIWQGIYNSTGCVFIAAGRTDKMFRAGFVLAAVLSGSFAVGVYYGPLGVAAGYAGGLLLVLPWYLWYTYSTVGLEIRKAFEGVVRGPLAASAVMALAVRFVGQTPAAEWSSAVLLIIQVATGVLIYPAALLLFSRKRTTETCRWVAARLKSPSPRKG